MQNSLNFKKKVQIFKFSHIDKSTFNIGIFVEGINIDLIKILLTLSDIKLYSLKNYKDDENITNIEHLYKNEQELCIALKSLNLIITNNLDVIRLSKDLNQHTIAILNQPVDVEQKNFYQFVLDEHNDIEKIFVKIKFLTEKIKIKQKENFLLSCIKSLENDKYKSEEYKLYHKSGLYNLLFLKTGKNLYLKEDIKTIKKLIKLKPENEIYSGNLATYKSFNTKEIDEARKLWDKVFPTLKDDNLIYNYACFQFNQKNFDDFFKYYDRRFTKITNRVVYPHFTVPEWSGEKDVSDKTILVYYEQGFGDSILFGRYLEYIPKLFKTVYCIIQPELKILFQGSFPNIVFIDNYKNIEFDYHIPVMSLPAALGLYPDKYKKTSWLKADKNKVKEFKKYFSKNNYNIGIFWESGKDNPIKRFTSLETFMPLAYIDKVKLYSLHIDKIDKEVNYIDDSVEIVNLGKHFKDFSDTAGAIENCDLIVTTDSAVLNLAGALGKKTFGIFNKNNEWRWYKLTGENVGLFKSVKPFQTTKEDDFKPVIYKICSEIKSLIQDKFNN